jgi:glycerol-3-phosphate dehydrogenase subunit B
VGTIKQTYCVPETMWKGVEILEKKSPCMLIDIQGLKGFSARQAVTAFEPVWPDLHAARIVFPGTEHRSEVFTEQMAFDLELPQTREKFARLLKPLIKNVNAIGMPAIYGLYRTAEVFADLEKRIGIHAFEVSTMPPSIPGLRLKHVFEQNLPVKGVRLFLQNQVRQVHQESNGGFVLKVGNTHTEHTIRTRGVVLASGRFLGGGLHADRKRIRETIFNLPVYQPEERKAWHREDFLDPRGHPINQAGLEIDDDFRPLDRSGGPAFQTLFAAGSILAHQDWMRMKCGSGLAIGTAFGAVQAFIRQCR